MRPSITGLVLAGGQGSRLGGLDKGLVEVAGRPLVAHVLARFAPQVDAVLVNANRNLDAYAAYGHPVVADTHADYPGPLAGIASGLGACRSPLLAVAPCDTPFLPTDLVTRLYATLDLHAAEIAVARVAGELQPVFALMRGSLGPALDAFLRGKRRKLLAWYEQHRLAVADFDEPDAFRNLNTAEDCALAAEALHAGAGRPRLLGIAGYSGSGKTTLLTGLIPRLRAAGLRLGVLKHAHHHFDIDHPGKDTPGRRRVRDGRVRESRCLHHGAQCRARPTAARPARPLRGTSAGPGARGGLQARALSETRSPSRREPLSGRPGARVTRPPVRGGRLHHRACDRHRRRAAAPAAAVRRRRPGRHHGVRAPALRIATLRVATTMSLGPTMNDQTVKTQPSCDDDYDPASLTCEEALQRLLAAVTPITDQERVHLRAALGRVLAEPVHARFDVPAHTNSAMDGYAVASADLPADGVGELVVVGTSLAGKPFREELRPGEAVRIMTGAVMPAGADTVLIQERVEERDGRIRFMPGNKPGQHVRRAGEDLATGAVAFSPGRRLSAADIGVIASLGVAEVEVLRRPRIAFFSTGDELRSLGEPLALGEIYDSNRYTLYGMLTQLGVELVDLGVVSDDPARLEDAFTRAARVADAVITSGGVSVGEADYTKEILGRLGEVRFWKVAMKPGKPVMIGTLGDAVVLGLPGNPVSAFVTATLFLRPMIAHLLGSGRPIPPVRTARLGASLPATGSRAEYLRGRWLNGHAVPLDGQDSAGLSALMEAELLIVRAPDAVTLPAGAESQIIPLA